MSIGKIIRLVTKCPERSMIQVVKQRLGKNLIGVEIGVREGRNAKNILRTLSIETLYLVDPYEEFTAENNEFYSQEYMDKIRLKASWNTVDYPFQTCFIVEKSIKAIYDIPDNLDFVYIDGSHNCKDVEKDIRLYYPKIREGGIIGGHDFSIGTTSNVVRAVMDFIKENNIEDNQCGSSGLDWWVVK